MSHYENGATPRAYVFVKNIQGDITAVYDANGTCLVTYTYDAWGNVTVSYSNGGASTAARYNPFRYRGYYYDSETSLYYLNSRYYDPNVGRFLNADIYINANGDLLGFNMFAYCGNNPVNSIDPQGTSILGALVMLGIVTFSALLLNSCGNTRSPRVITPGGVDQELANYLAPGGYDNANGAIERGLQELALYLDDEAEVGGYVYHNTDNGKYYFSNVQQISATSTSCFIDMTGMPQNGEVIATIHTHLSLPKGPREGWFSLKEWQDAHGRWDVYAMDAGSVYVMRKYSPSYDVFEFVRKTPGRN